MRSEMREQRLVTGSKKSRHFADHVDKPALEKNRAQDRDALDVAFENYTRIDNGIVPVPDSGATYPSEAKITTKAIIADISTQLDALDRQRQRLADLLRDISI